MDFVGAIANSSSSSGGGDNGPIMYLETNRTAAVDDIRSVLINVFFVTLFISFLVIFPGIRQEKFPTFLCVITSLGVGAIILNAAIGTTWHVGHAHVSAPYKAFSRDKIYGELRVNIGLMSVNITLRAFKLHSTSYKGHTLERSKLEFNNEDDNEDDEDDNDDYDDFNNNKREPLSSTTSRPRHWPAPNLPQSGFREFDVAASSDLVSNETSSSLSSIVSANLNDTNSDDELLIEARTLNNDEVNENEDDYDEEPIDTSALNLSVDGIDNSRAKRSQNNNANNKQIKIVNNNGVRERKTRRRKPFIGSSVTNSKSRVRRTEMQKQQVLQTNQQQQQQQVRNSETPIKKTRDLANKAGLQVKTTDMTQNSEVKTKSFEPNSEIKMEATSTLASTSSTLPRVDSSLKVNKSKKKPRSSEKRKRRKPRDNKRNNTNEAKQHQAKQHADSHLVDINYNERFSWIGPKQMSNEFYEARKRGLPYPILTVIDYLSQDDAGFSWSRKYRRAGYYCHITMWLSFYIWILMIALHCAAPRFGVYTMQILGTTLLSANLIYAMLVPTGQQSLVIPYEGQELSFRFGWSFWSVAIAGCVSLLVGSIIVIIDWLFPNYIFTTILDVDFDSHHKYIYNKQKQNQALLHSSNVQQANNKQSDEVEELNASTWLQTRKATPETTFGLTKRYSNVTHL